MPKATAEYKEDDLRLNLPDIPEFIEAKRVLIAGAGGGFDVYTGIPIGIELEERGVEVQYLSFGNKVIDDTTGEQDFRPTYAEEVLNRHLSATGRRLELCPRMGVIPYRKSIDILMSVFKFDAVVLCDGGVDSLMRGDEESPGTLLEDSVSLSAFMKYPIPIVLACLGIGTEVEEKLCHYRAMENISDLFTDGFAGCSALTSQMRAFEEYKKICELGWANGHRVSHIQSRVIKSVEGHFGKLVHHIPTDANMASPSEQPPFITPLMAIYWFFDARKVAQRNLLVEALDPTTTWTDVRMIYREHLNNLKLEQVRQDKPFTI